MPRPRLFARRCTRSVGPWKLDELDKLVRHYNHIRVTQTTRTGEKVIAHGTPTAHKRAPDGTHWITVTSPNKETVFRVGVRDDAHNNRAVYALTT